MPAQPTLYTIKPTGNAEQLAVEQVWSGDAPLSPGYKKIMPVSIGGTGYLLAFQPGGGFEAFRINQGDPPLGPYRAGLTLGRDFDIVEAFAIGGQTYILGYGAANGQMSFFPMASDLSIGVPYVFLRARPPGVSKDFTVVKPLSVGGLVYLLAYGSATGAVKLYSLAATAAPAAGSPINSAPLLATAVWEHEWARNWEHFAFFELGGENFFFKINTGKLNVNIDHVLDDPSAGTVEVGTYLELEDALSLDIVRSFSLEAGDPFLAMYKTDGTTWLRRIRGDCQGWVDQTQLVTVTDASDIVPFQVGGDSYLLFC